MVTKNENIAVNKYTTDRSQYTRKVPGAPSPSLWLILKDTKIYLTIGVRVKC